MRRLGEATRISFLKPTESVTRGRRPEHLSEAGREKMWEQPGEKGDDEEEEEGGRKGSVLAVPKPRGRADPPDFRGQMAQGEG